MNESSKASSGWKAGFRTWLGRLIARKWFDVGLRSKMSALVTVGLTGLIATFALIGITTVRQATQQLLAEHVLRARILAETLDSNLGQVGGLLTILSSQVDMENPESNLQDWRRISGEDFRSVQGIYLFDREAKLIAALGETPGIDWKIVPAIRGAADISTRIVSVEGMPRPYALIAVPVMEDGTITPAGVLAAVLDLSNPDIFLSNSSLGLEHNGTFQVLGNDGRVLVSSRADQTLSPGTIEKIRHELFVEGEPMVEACLGCTGDELKETGTVIAFAPLRHVPWGVVIWHDSQELFAPVRRLGVQALVLGVLAMLGAFFLVMVTTRSVIAPVQMLTDATRKISDVQFDASTLKSVECTLAASLGGKTSRRRDEIGILSNSFIAMCTRLQLSIEEIQALNRELDARVHARTRQLSTLNAVALTVNQSLNLKEILDRALDEVLQLTGIDMVAIFLLDPSRGDLKLQAFRGLSEQAARLAYQVGLLDGSCGGVVELGEPVVVPDISTQRGRGAESLQREHVRAVMHVPLMNKGRVLGSMCLGTHDGIRFDPEEQQSFTAIGNQIAIAVENARLYADVQHKERLRGELFQKALAAQEEERKRIARELHDEISQSLTALLYEAEEALERASNPRVKERLQSVCELTQRTLDDVHTLMFDLRPSMLDQLGLIPALRWLAQSRLETKGIRVSIEMSSNVTANGNTDIQRLSPEMETALFRVIQEAIHNIARHAAARSVAIRLELEESRAMASIEDDGIGFDLSELSAVSMRDIEGSDSFLTHDARGLGLLGMQERIELLGGELQINTAPGSGTQIHIEVPLQERSLVDD